MYKEKVADVLMQIDSLGNCPSWKPKLRKDGRPKLTGLSIVQDHKPPKNHPWRGAWATHPNSFNRSKESGYKYEGSPR